jgi:hypothetical protein
MNGPARKVRRTDHVKERARPVWSPSTEHGTPEYPRFAFLRPHRPIRSVHFIQELTMADPAFVAITIAVFALVALVAKAVTKL